MLLYHMTEVIYSFVARKSRKRCIMYLIHFIHIYVLFIKDYRHRFKCTNVVNVHKHHNAEIFSFTKKMVYFVVCSKFI